MSTKLKWGLESVREAKLSAIFKIASAPGALTDMEVRKFCLWVIEQMQRQLDGASRRPSMPVELRDQALAMEHFCDEAVSALRGWVSGSASGAQICKAREDLRKYVMSYAWRHPTHGDRVLRQYGNLAGACYSALHDDKNTALFQIMRNLAQASRGNTLFARAHEWFVLNTRPVSDEIEF